MYHSDQEGPWNSNLLARLNEHVSNFFKRKCYNCTEIIIVTMSMKNNNPSYFMINQLSPSWNSNLLARLNEHVSNFFKRKCYNCTEIIIVTMSMKNNNPSYFMINQLSPSISFHQMTIFFIKSSYLLATASSHGNFMFLK